MQHVIAVANWLDFKVSNPFKGLKKRWNQHKVYRQTISELSALTDRELNDMGIHRGMISSIAMEVYLDNREV